MRFRGETDDEGEGLTAAPIGFAILGTGIIAETHRQAIAMNANLGARLVAVGHYDPSRFAAIGERFGVPCLSEAELLKRPDVDVVCVATPSGQHAEQAIAAAEAGKHVLVEKPLALGLADADAMIAACDTAGVRLGCCSSAPNHCSAGSTKRSAPGTLATSPWHRCACRTTGPRRTTTSWHGAGRGSRTAAAS